MKLASAETDVRESSSLTSDPQELEPPPHVSTFPAAPDSAETALDYKAPVAIRGQQQPVTVEWVLVQPVEPDNDDLATPRGLTLLRPGDAEESLLLPLFLPDEQPQRVEVTIAGPRSELVLADGAPPQFTRPPPSRWTAAWLTLVLLLLFSLGGLLLVHVHRSSTAELQEALDRQEREFSNRLLQIQEEIVARPNVDVHQLRQELALWNYERDIAKQAPESGDEKDQATRATHLELGLEVDPDPAD
ncbi:MAG TPA: hypothetical protein VGR35_09900 [Tepidisphaeraceae bacterium]|nr:hypothetical protein [Tepidisphaeraceae bacterium]